MTPTRTGKIARLPRVIREELNERLQDGQQGRKLVAWLNALPAVQRVVAVQFAGRPIRAQNLSEWKKGGYRDWLLVQQARSAIAPLTAQTAAQTAPGNSPQELGSIDTLAHWLTARYALASRHLAASAGPEQWRMLREMCADVIELRRGDHCAQRLQLERARLAVAERDALMKWKRQIIAGLEAIERQTARNPASQQAFDQLASILRHPYDPSESG